MNLRFSYAKPKKNQGGTSRPLAWLWLVLAFAGCSGDAFKWPTSTQNSISGAVIPFGGVSSLRSLTGTSTCPTAVANLYAISPAGDKVHPAIQTAPVQGDGTYTFTNLRQLGIRVRNVNQLSANYIVEVTGCNAGYSRLLTATDKQDVNWGTTLVSYITGTDQPGAASVDRAKLNELYTALNVHGDFDSAYGDLTTIPALTNKFQTVLGSNPVVLEDASPMLVTLNAPTGVHEGSATALALTAVQWQSTFPYAFRWEVDGNLISTAASASYTPSGNMQGAHALTVKWGQDAGGGVLDTTKPYRSESVPFWVNDAVPVTAPLFAAVPAHVATPNVNVQLQTGAAMANCDSFSGLAITETPVAPLSPTQYSITCSAAPTQNVPFLLSGGVGTYTLYLWAMDAAGNISAPRTTTVTYNNAVPVLTITSPLASDPPYSGSVTVSGACETASGDVTLSGGINPSPQLTACNAGTYSETVNLSAGDGSKTITAAQTNMFGTTGSASVTITNDTTGPTVSITSTAPSDTNVAAIPVTFVFSEAVTGFTSSDLVIGNGTVSAFAGSGDTYTATITSSGQGAVTVTVPAAVAFDSAGNGNVANSLSRTYDTIQPSVTLTTAAADPTNLAAVPVTVTFTEAVTGFALSDLTLSNATASGLAGSGTTYTFNLNPTAQGAFSAQVNASAAADAAGNASTASNTLSMTYDNVRPTATLSTTAPTPTRTSPIPYSVVFSEAVTGFALADLTLVNGTASNLVGSGTTYTFDVTPSAQGAVSATVPANSADDSAANGNTASSTVGVVYDSVAPGLTITSPSVGQGSNVITMTFSGACEAGLPISITGTGLASPSSATCTAGNTYSEVITFTAGDGIKTISLTQTDVAGNTTTVSRAVPFDTSPPTIIFASPAVQTQLTNTNTVVFHGSCETGINVVVGGADSSSVSCTGSMWTYTTASQTTDATRTYTFTQTDPGGNAVSITGTWERETVPPGLTRTSPADGTRAQSSVTITGACETGLVIDFTGTGLVSDLHPTCSGGAYSQTVFFSNGDGTKTMNLRQTDAAGNVTDVPLSFVRDNVGPNLTQTLRTSPWWTNTNTTSFGGACETGQTISVTVDGTPEGTTTCPAGTWTYTTGSQTSDATRTYAFTQTDSASNSTTVSAQWVRRTTNPNLTITSALARLTATNSVTFTGTCMTGVSVVVTGADTSSTTCSGGTWSYTTASQGTDGTRTYNFRQTDLAGNTTLVSDTWQRDATLPNLTVTTSSPVITSGNSTSFSGACDNAYPIAVSGAETTSISCVGGAWSFTANQVTDASHVYNFRQTAPSTAYTQVSITWIRDTVAPTLSSFSFNGGAAITNTSYVRAALSASDSRTNVTKFCFKPNNTAPNSGDSCWIPVTANPPNLVPAPTLSLSNFSYYLGITPGTFTVYAWTMDAAGNISTNAASSGVDRTSIDYQIIYPPVLDTIYATNTATPGFPVPSPQLSVNAGQTVYIKWRATAGLNATLGATPIQLSFTTDDVNWSSIATVANAANGGCTLHTSAADAGTTGCYNWAAPTSGFFRLRIEVADTGERKSALTPPPLNTGSFKLVAGNTEPGVNTSTLASIYQFRKQRFPTMSQPNAFVITTTGVAYINDHYRGILKVDPADGLTQVFIPRTGVTSSNGSVSTATVRNVLGIALDFNDRLLIWDNNQIRRVDLVANTITRIIGGGVDTSATVNDALDLAFEGWQPLPDNPADSEFAWRTIRVAMIPLPNGDLYFGSKLDVWLDPNHKFRRYTEFGSPQITQISPFGFGHTGGTAPDISKCNINSMALAFDPANSAIIAANAGISEYGSSTSQCYFNGGKAPAFHHYFYEVALEPNFQASAVQPVSTGLSTTDHWFTRTTGRNGKLYAFRRSYSEALEYDPTAKTWTRILGTQTSGHCPDNTPALSCNMQIQDMFVTAQGQIFFLDRGRIRTLDASNRVLTLFGQDLSSGNGGDPLLARFNFLWGMGLGNDGRVIVWDEDTLREVSGDRSVVNLIAGDGRPDWARTGGLAVTLPFQPGADWSRGTVVVDPATNDVFTVGYGPGLRYGILRLVRSTGEWTSVVGGGSTGYHAADGLAGNQVKPGLWGDYTSEWFDSSLPIGFGGGRLLTMHSTYPEPDPKWKNNMIKLYDPADSYRQSHLVGRSGLNDDTWTICGATGNDVNDCTLPVMVHMARAQYDSVDRKWILSSNRTQDADYRLYSVPDNLGDSAPRSVSVFTTTTRIAKNFAYWRTGGHEYIYYCGNDQKLYRHDKNTSTEVQLLMPSAEMKCLPNTNIDIDRANSRLYFNFELNHLHAIGSVSAI